MDHIEMVDLVAEATLTQPYGAVPVNLDDWTAEDEAEYRTWLEDQRASGWFVR